MAERRMISASVIQSDDFLDLSFEAQALYFQLIMSADNFGFVSGVKRLVRGVGVSENALEALKNERFILAFDSGVIVISHWFVANWGNDFSKGDRVVKTVYLDELSMLDVDSMGAYVRKGDDISIRQCGGQDSIQSKVREYIKKLLPQNESNDEFEKYIGDIPWIDYSEIREYRNVLSDDTIRYIIEKHSEHSSWIVVKNYLDRIVRTSKKSDGNICCRIVWFPHGFQMVSMRIPDGFPIQYNPTQPNSFQFNPYQYISRKGGVGENPKYCASTLRYR